LERMTQPQLIERIGCGLDLNQRPLGYEGSHKLI